MILSTAKYFFLPKYPFNVVVRTGRLRYGAFQPTSLFRTTLKARSLSVFRLPFSMLNKFCM